MNTDVKILSNVVPAHRAGHGVVVSVAVGTARVSPGRASSSVTAGWGWNVCLQHPVAPSPFAGREPSGRDGFSKGTGEGGEKVHRAKDFVKNGPCVQGTS